MGNMNFVVERHFLLHTGVYGDETHTQELDITDNRIQLHGCLLYKYVF